MHGTPRITTNPRPSDVKRAMRLLCIEEVECVDDAISAAVHDGKADGLVQTIRTVRKQNMLAEMHEYLSARPYVRERQDVLPAQGPAAYGVSVWKHYTPDQEYPAPLGQTTVTYYGNIFENGVGIVLASFKLMAPQHLEDHRHQG
jgi:hypothetical protein